MAQFAEKGPEVKTKIVQQPNEIERKRNEIQEYERR